MSDTTGDNGLTDENATALAHVLDEVIPPSIDGRLPGAGELGLGAEIWERSPDLRPVIEQGLAGLAELTAARGASDFGSLSAAARAEVLNELAAAQPVFLPGLIFHTYTGYYQKAPVLEGLGLEGRAPHPLGYELEMGDLDLLEPVRQRKKLYRETS